MTNVFIRKLESFGPLPDDDKDLIVSLAGRTETIAGQKDLIREGDKPDDVNLILSGFAFRYKTLRTGRRQIVAYLFPGDFCDLHVCILDAMDHNIAALTEVQVVKLPRHRVLALLERPAIARALLMATLVDEATLREWLVNIGQRPAEHRLAHLFCEWHLRLKAVGLTTDGECELPLTQAELGDTTGLSTVHVNRSLQSLRAQGLITLKSKMLVIPDIEKLRKMSGFRPNYLHLLSEGSDLSQSQIPA